VTVDALDAFENLRRGEILQRVAETLGLLRSALLEQGFSPPEAGELCRVWMLQALQGSDEEDED
jgi:hypothetical protein